MRKSVAFETWELVHSLTASEKAYFKKSVSNRSGSKLKTVFDAINKQSEFDADKLDAKVKAVYSEVLAAYRLLRTAVLRSLAQYHSTSSPLIEINLILSQVRIAKGKRLFSICNKLIDKGLEIASDNELPMYEYIFWELKSNLPVADPKESPRQFEDCSLHMMNVADLAKANAEFVKAQGLEQQFNRWGKITKEGYDRFKDRFQLEYFKEQAEVLSRNGNVRLQAKMRNMIMAYLYSIGRWEDALTSGLDTLERMGNPDELSDKKYAMWAATMGNVIGISALANNQKVFKRLRSELFSADEKRQNKLDVRFYSNMKFHDIADLLKSGNTNKALEEILEIEQSAGKPELSAHYDKTYLNRCVTEILFVKGDYHAVLERCNLFLSNSIDKQDVRALYSLRWLELAASFMLNDKTLFASKHRSVKRFLDSYNSGFDWEKDILKTMQTSVNQSSADRQNSFKTLLSQLEESKFEIRSCIQGISLLTWIESLALNRPMAALVKEKYLN